MLVGREGRGEYDNQDWSVLVHTEYQILQRIWGGVGEVGKEEERGVGRVFFSFFLRTIWLCQVFI